MINGTTLAPERFGRFSPTGEKAAPPIIQGEDSAPTTPPRPQNAALWSPSARETLKLETTGLSRHATQQRFEFDRVIVAQQIVGKLDEAGRPDLADPLRECHQHFTVKQCCGCSKVTKFWNHCDTSWCPNCQPRLARKRFEEIQFWAETAKQAKHVVLTCRNVPVLTKSFVRRFRNAFVKLRRSKFARNWEGGCYSLEITNEGRGWHLHLHALIDARWIDAVELSIRWGKLVGQDFGIVKVKDCRGKDYLREVTKYAVKGTDLAKWAGEQIIEFALAFKGVRTFGTFGTLYRRRAEWAAFKKQLATDREACECGCSTFRYFSPDEWEWHEQTCGERPPPTLKLAENQPRFSFADFRL